MGIIIYQAKSQSLFCTTQRYTSHKAIHASSPAKRIINKPIVSNIIPNACNFHNPYILRIQAGIISGMWSNRESSRARSGLYPSHRATVNVDAKRDIPGNNATPCIMPNTTAVSNTENERCFACTGQERNDHNNPAVIQKPSGNGNHAVPSQENNRNHPAVKTLEQPSNTIYVFIRCQQRKKWVTR